MKKRIQTMATLFIGVLVGIVISTSTGALGTTIERVEATFAKFSLSINGGETLEIEPLTYRGTTYLQVREMANLLGYDVTYKSDSRTIELNHSPILERRASSTVTYLESYSRELLIGQIEVIEFMINENNERIRKLSPEDQADIDFLNDEIADLMLKKEQREQRLNELDDIEGRDRAQENIDNQLTEIEGKIENILVTIESLELMLESDLPEEAERKIRESISEQSNELTELRQRKSLLESQK